jgi:hypothetical protein
LRSAVGALSGPMIIGAHVALRQGGPERDESNLTTSVLHHDHAV